MTMNEKKYKRLEYLRHNINYLTIRERQEYYDLLNELKKAGNQSEPEESEEFEEYVEPEYEYSDYETESFQKNTSSSNGRNASREEIREKVFQIKKTTEINHQKKKVNLLKKLNLAKKKKRHWLRTILTIIVCDHCGHDWFLLFMDIKGALNMRGSVAKQEEVHKFKKFRTVL